MIRIFRRLSSASASKVAGAALVLASVVTSELSAFPGALHAARDWVATLSGREGRKVTGTATVAPSADGKGIDVSVTLTGDTPGATRPWHIHTGSCAKSGGVFGGGRAYTPIVIDGKGNGTGKATVPAVPADTSTYYVNIHDSAAAMSIIVACGDLTKK